MSAISAMSVSKAFGEERAIDRLDFEVGEGEIHALVGLNGAGKTTLMQMVLGMTKPDSGRVLIDGVEAPRAPRATWARVGQMLEAPFGYPELTVQENLLCSARLHGVSPERTVTWVGDIVERFALGHWADRRARHLSLGNRQRLGLACALVHRPQIIVLDEPTNALDPAGVVFMRDLLRHEAETAGASVLVSSHHLDELARVAHRISVIHRGRLVGSIDPQGIDLERRFFDLVYGSEVVGGGVENASEAGRREAVGDA